MNHLTLYAYEEDGELIVWRCPEESCGTVGPKGSRCEAHESPMAAPELGGPTRQKVRVPTFSDELRRCGGSGVVHPEWDQPMANEPCPGCVDCISVRVPGVGEEREIRDGLTALHEYLRLNAGETHRQHGEACGVDACVLCLAESTVEKLLDHFTQQPAGVGAESSPSRKASCSADSRDPEDTPRPSADSDGNQQPPRRRQMNHRDWLNKQVEAAEADGRKLAPTSRGAANLANAHASAFRSALQHYEEGSDIQCDGVALAQPSRDGWSAPDEAIDAAWRAVESLEDHPPIHRNVLALAVSAALRSLARLDRAR